jgi:hypothetical protein
LLIAVASNGRITICFPSCTVTLAICLIGVCEP